MAMRDDIHKAIMEGGATKESLLELTGTTEKGLASQFTYLRMTGKCPRKKEDGTFEIISTEEWEAHRASSGSSTTPLTPAERVEKGEKRSKRAASAYDNAKKRHEADTSNRLNELKFIKAQAELEIAEIELGKAEEDFLKAEEEGESQVMDEGETQVVTSDDIATVDAADLDIENETEEGELE